MIDFDNPFARQQLIKRLERAREAAAEARALLSKVTGIVEQAQDMLYQADRRLDEHAKIMREVAEAIEAATKR